MLDSETHELMDAISKMIIQLVAVETDRAESRLRVELCKSQNAESHFVRAELLALRDDLCRILRGGSEPSDVNMHLSDQHRRTSAEIKT
jgi:hypothetical protein